MSEEFDIQGNVKIETGDAEAALQKLRDKQAAADKKSQADQLAVMSKAGTMAMVAGAALLAGVGVMTKDAASAETVQKGLATALKNTGQYSVATMTHIDDLTNSLRKQTGVSDEVQKSALAFASTMKLTEGQSEKLLPLLLDMSAVTGMDLEQAFRASAQAMTGNVGLFQRYGVIIKKSADGTVDFNDVLKQLQIYAGQAAAKVSGLEGSGIKLKSALDELGESLGTTLIPELTKAIGGVASLVEKFNDAPDAMKEVVTQSTLVAGGILLVFGVTQKVVTGLAAMKTGFDVLTAGAGWTAFMAALPFLAAIAGVAATALAISEIIQKNKVEGTTAIVPNAPEGTALQQAANPLGYAGGSVPAQGGRGTINRGVVVPTVGGAGSGSPDRTWTPTMQSDLVNVQAGKYTSPGPVSSTAAQIAANADIAHKLYDASHTEKQQELHDLDLEVAAYRKAGDDKVLIAQYSAARRAEIEKKYAKKSAAESWSPINVSGVNVNGLSSYIGSLSGAVKVKKQTLELTLKIDGTAIKVDQSALSKLKDTLGSLVYAKVMAALGGSAAFGG